MDLNVPNKKSHDHQQQGKNIFQHAQPVVVAAQLDYCDSRVGVLEYILPCCWWSWDFCSAIQIP